MSSIDELLSRLAPDGVQHRALQEVGSFVRGGGPQKKDFSDEGVGCIHYGQIYTHYGIHTSTTLSHVSPEAAARSRRAQPGDVIIAVTGENDADLARAVAWLGDAPVAVSNHTLIYTSSLDPKYVSYFLRSSGFSEQKKTRIYGTKVRSISAQQFGTIRIPVPPVEVQREIVRILDHFTGLEAELEAELEARRAQRTALANNLAVAVRDDEHERTQSERVLLGEIARESVEPVRIHAEQSYASLGVKWNGEGVLYRTPRSGHSIKATTLYRARPGQLIYNRMFVVEGSFALVPDRCSDAVVSGEFPLFEIDESRVEPQWLLQHLCDPYTLKRIEAEVTGTERGSMKSRRRWKADQFREFEIKLPTLAEQRRTVAALQASTDLLASLEQELAERRKQSQYYRDKLLTFEEKR